MMMIHERGAEDGMKFYRGKKKYFEEHLLQCSLVHHGSYMT
jgi:hypothetical protein